MEIIPAIDLRGGKAVRLYQGDYDQETVYFDDPADAAKQWECEGAPRIHLVDLDGARDGVMKNRKALITIRESVNVPTQLGGGIRTMEDVERVLEDIKIDRAILGSVLLEHPAFAKEAAKKYPDQIILGIDARNGYMATRGWREDSTILAADVVKEFEGYPFAAVIYTDIAMDGTLKGPNYDAQVEMAGVSPFPVIASGGVGTLEHIKELAYLACTEEGQNICGVITGKALYEKKFTMKEALEAAM